MAIRSSGKRERPGPGQESVWDYPRPPRLERSSASIVIEFGGQILVRTERSYRVLETSHPPVHYIAISDVTGGALRPADRRSWCEWKGEAAYYDVVLGNRSEAAAAWWYPQPTRPFAELADHVAFYPGRMDSCSLDGERVEAQSGDFYGGWRTSRVVGPFKGGPGTWGW
ncbi:MAG TPA: DUF427 domain-containing protein [Frankiaceae bacterium]|jgi:uncharacterized protein (DUF427 family)|nr:DUF427 domain-containing protein [Frankiaceae bacterium]